MKQRNCKKKAPRHICNTDLDMDMDPIGEGSILHMEEEDIIIEDFNVDR